MRNFLIHILSFIIIIIINACSTTKLIPEGEMLYTGTKKIEIINPEDAYITPEAQGQVISALSTPPNNAVLGSMSIRILFPVVLWISTALHTVRAKRLER